VVEEPESFLHPSAQAEFGRVLQDLAEEFQVQVIVTTHSPYLLNLKEPGSNILLRRHSAYRQLRETERVDTSEDNWMAPFGQALGLDAEEFKPWKSMVLAASDAILLVEGETASGTVISNFSISIQHSLAKESRRVSIATLSRRYVLPTYPESLLRRVWQPSPSSNIVDSPSMPKNSSSAAAFNYVAM
jgi:predicted ATP-dependent endonuclease of OLD family